MRRGRLDKESIIIRFMGIIKGAIEIKDSSTGNTEFLL